jgi:putative ATP-dependent endonuclease of the OLD family
VKLERIEISNFKSFRSAAFVPAQFGCLVGENNAGKSSILQAVVMALGRPSQLQLGAFYDPALPVEFYLEFSGVTENHLLRLAGEHRSRIAQLVSDGTIRLIVRYRPEQKVEIATKTLVPRDPRYSQESIDTALAGRRGAAIRDAANAAYPELVADMPTGLAMAATKEWIATAISALPRDEFELAEAPLSTGIGSSITALLPEPIYIPAVKNFADDLKTTQSTSLGRLLGLLLQDMEPDLALIEQSLAQLNQLLNRVTVEGRAQDRRHRKVQDLENLVESLLGQNFPSAKVELHIPPPELKAILNAAQIYVDDGSRDLVDNKGDGLRRSFAFALLQAYVRQLNAGRQEERANVPALRPLIFLFEEPELYLHPKSQRVLFNTLGKIAESHQVVVTTHSPLFFAPGVTATFVRVSKRTAMPKPIGVLNPVNFALDARSAEVFRLARFENCDAAFFSGRVVLFEGESDDAYIRHVAKLLNPDWDFDLKNVALVRVSGKGNFAKFRDFFSAFGIEVKVVADLDALFDGYQHLGAGVAAADARQLALREIDACIARREIVAQPNSRQIRRKVGQDSFKGRYDIAKAALRAVQAGGPVDANTVAALDGLFDWEQDLARELACRHDPAAGAALVPLLDALRRDGVCVLSRGAIEEYYPEGVPAGGAKPDRALQAAALLTTADEALVVSAPLAHGRAAELVEVVQEIFRGL